MLLFKATTPPPPLSLTHTLFLFLLPLGTYAPFALDLLKRGFTPSTSHNWELVMVRCAFVCVRPSSISAVDSWATEWLLLPFLLLTHSAVGGCRKTKTEGKEREREAWIAIVPGALKGIPNSPSLERLHTRPHRQQLVCEVARGS